MSAVRFRSVNPEQCAPVGVLKQIATPPARANHWGMIVGVQPLAGFDKLLHYKVPETLRAALQTGSLVRVPILNRSHLGLVTEVNAVPDCPPEKLKAVTAVLHNFPALTPDLLELARWIHTYYAARM